MDSDIEAHDNGCLSCQSCKGAPPVAPLHPWIWPSKLWQCIHVDYAGPFKGCMFLVVVDAHSKWPEVQEVSSATTEKSMVGLQECFARYGLPQLVSDNEPQFISGEVEEFLKHNGICHVRTAPYHVSPFTLHVSYRAVTVSLPCPERRRDNGCHGDVTAVEGDISVVCKRRSEQWHLKARNQEQSGILSSRRSSSTPGLTLSRSSTASSIKHCIGVSDGKFFDCEKRHKTASARKG